MTPLRTRPSLPRETWLLATFVPLLGIVAEVAVFPAMWRVIVQSEAVNFLVIIALAFAISAAVSRVPRVWIAVVVAEVIVADVIQSFAEVALMALAAESGGSGVSGYVLPSTGDEMRMIVVLRLQANLLEFGFFAAAVSLILTQRTALEARLRHQTAALDVLRLQLAPHFLLNAFNSLLTLIEGDRRHDAKRLVLNLSRFFRSVLLSSHQASTSLEQELENLGDYLAIEETRYGDRLNVRVTITPEAAAAAVPPMLLQPLVENVVHHVVAHTTAAVNLDITAAIADGALEIKVSNSIPDDWRPAHQGTGVGQLNVADRLALIHGEAATLTGTLFSTSYDAVIRIPPSDGRP